MHTNKAKASNSDIKATMDKPESHPIQEEHIEAYVDEVEIEHSNGQVRLRGDLIVSSDEWPPATTVGLHVTINEVVLEAGSKPHYVRLSRGTSVHGKTLLTQLMPGLKSAPTRIEFDTGLDIELDAKWPYRLWEVVVEPVDGSSFKVNSKVYRKRIRIQSEKKPDVSDTLRVMTFNIHAGYGMDEVLDLERIADVIACSGADIIGLQEVDIETRRSDGKNQAAILADMLDMEYYFGANLFFRRGSHGNLFLSRYPITSADNTLLPYRDTSQRGLLRAQVDYNGTPITIFVTHLGFRKDSIMQRERILEELYKVNEPFILLGDFNMDPLRPNPSLHDTILNMPHPVDPGKITARNIFDPLVKDVWLQFKSFPGNESPKGIHHGLGKTLTRGGSRIDYIFVSDEFDIVNGSEGVFMIESIASDHLPVVSTVKISGKENDVGS